MRRPSGHAAVRLSLGTLLLATFAMALVQPADAGTAEAPEIQDPAGDQTVAGQNAQNQAGTRIDILSVWIDQETATTINVNILLSNIPGGATSASAQWEFHATLTGGTEVVAIATAAGGQQTLQPPVAGSNVQSVAVDGNTLIMTIDKSVYGATTGVLTNLFAVGQGRLPLPSPGNAVFVSDRAPNSGAGQDYPMGGAGGPPGCPNCTADDTDGDGLNDTWEQQYFGNITAQNATGDPDGDGLTNGQEEALGTDPTNPDTDGDGVNDKDDPFPLDPTRGGSNGTSSSSSSSGSASRTSTNSTTSGTRSATGTATGSGTATPDKCADDDTTDAVDCLTSDAGYLGMSAGGFLAVLILCIIALATRWSL